MKGKQNINIQREIKFLSVEEERKFENNNVASSSYGSIHESVTYLGIHSEKAATLLNEVINWRIKTCSTKANKEYCDGVDSLKGGGLFVKCNAEVVISSIGEVGLKFKEAYGEYIKKYIRAVSARAEINKAIKDKIANELKRFWTTYSKYLKDHNGVIKIMFTNRNGDDVAYEYRETDYRILYEVLKGRDVDKLKAKYDQVKWDEMIGKKWKISLSSPQLKQFRMKLQKLQKLATTISRMQRLNIVLSPTDCGLKTERTRSGSQMKQWKKSKNSRIKSMK